MTTPVSPPLRRRTYAPHLASAFLFAAALVVAGRTVQTARQRPSINPIVAVTPFADPVEKVGRLHDVTGTFATGSAPGDRMIVVGPGQRVRFQLVGPLEKALALDDEFELGRLAEKIVLSTRHSGPITALEIDQLSYFGDVYRRTK